MLFPILRLDESIALRIAPLTVPWENLLGMD